MHDYGYDYIAEYFESVIFHVNYLSYLPVFLCLYCTLNRRHTSHTRGRGDGAGAGAGGSRQAIARQSQRPGRVLDQWSPVGATPRRAGANALVVCRDAAAGRYGRNGRHGRHGRHDAHVHVPGRRGRARRARPGRYAAALPIA